MVGSRTNCGFRTGFFSCRAATAGAWVVVERNVVHDKMCVGLELWKLCANFVRVNLVLADLGRASEKGIG